MKPVSCMAKSEAAHYLTTIGETVPTSWTSVEIKSRIAELHRVIGEGATKVSIGVTTPSKKADIKKACDESGVNTTDDMTKGKLMRKLREKKEQTSAPQADNVMTIGKYSGAAFT